MYKLKRESFAKWEAEHVNASQAWQGRIPTPEREYIVKPSAIGGFEYLSIELSILIPTPQGMKYLDVPVEYVYQSKPYDSLQVKLVLIGIEVVVGGTQLIIWDGSEGGKNE
jgi:hypothetical protein